MKLSICRRFPQRQVQPLSCTDCMLRRSHSNARITNRSALQKHTLQSRNTCTGEARHVRCCEAVEAGGLRSAGDRAAATKKPWMIQSTKYEIRYPRVQYDAPFAIRGTRNSDMQGSAQAGARAKWVLVDDSTIGNAFGKANASILKKHTNFKRKLGERACQMQSSQHAGRWQWQRWGVGKACKNVAIATLTCKVAPLIQSPHVN